MTFIGKISTISNMTIDKWLFLLFLAQVVFITRFYFLANLNEFIMLLLIFFNRSMRLRLLDFCKSRVGHFFLFFLTYIVVSSLISNSFDRNGINEILSWRKLVLIPIGWLVINTRKRFEVLVRVIFAVGTIFLILSFFMYYNLTEFWGRDSTEILQNHSAQGIWFSICIFLGYFYREAFNRESFQALGVCLYGGVCILLAANLLVVGSGRSGYVVLLLVFTFLIYDWWHQFRNRKYSKYLLLLGSSLFICLWPFFGGVIEQSVTDSARQVQEFLDGSHSNNSSSIRIAMSLNAFELWLENPVFGTGGGLFGVRYDQLASGKSGLFALPSDNPHNFYLHLLAEYGVIGLISFLSFIFILASAIIKGSRRDHALVIFLITVGLILSFVNGFWSGFVIGRLFFILLGSLLGVAQPLLAEETLGYMRKNNGRI